MSVGTFLVAAGLAGAVSLFAGAAGATTYYLDVDGCANGCGLVNYGTIDVTPTDQTATTLKIDITLAQGVFFDTQSNTIDEIAFNAPASPQLRTTLPNNVANTNLFQTNSPILGVGKNEGPLGKFLFQVFWAQAMTPQPVSTLEFLITDGNRNLSLNPTTYNGQDLYFAVDIQHAVNGVLQSGVVGATLTPPPPPKSLSGAPEPAAWALMLAGFFGMGPALRRRRGAMGARA